MNCDTVKLSVVIPVYNAENHIEQTIYTLSDYFTDHSIIHEFILIDDNSTDTSLHVLNILLKMYPKLIIQQNEKNIGQDRSILKGIKISKYNICLLIDDDFDYSIDSIAVLLETLFSNKKDLVYGIPKQKKINWFRRMSSIWSHNIAKMLGYNDASNYKLISGELLNDLKSKHDSRIFNLDKYLLSSSSKYMYVLVDNIPNNYSRYSYFKLFFKFFNFMAYQKK